MGRCWLSRLATPVAKQRRRHSWSSINHKDRLTYPMIRRDGQLQRASWDEAMSLIVRRAKDIRQRLTSHGIGFYTTGQLLLEEYYVLAVVGKGGLNTLHMSVSRSSSNGRVSA